MKPNLPIASIGLASILLTAVMSAWAANTAQIKVTGTIMPAACGASFTGGGTFDYGHISAGVLSDTSANLLADAPKTDTLIISCVSPTKVSLTVTDYVAGSKDGSDGVSHVLGTNDNFLFGLGMATSTKLGAYIINLRKDHLTVDSEPGHYVESKDKGHTWANLPVPTEHLLCDAGGFCPDWLTSWATGEQTLPVAAKAVSIPVEVMAAIKPLGKLPSGGELKIDGQAAITLSIFEFPLASRQRDRRSNHRSFVDRQDNARLTGSPL